MAFLSNICANTHTSHSVGPREQEKDMQSTWEVDSVPFLPFMSSSSVVLQLSVDPCDERKRQCARWRDGRMKVGRREKKYRNTGLQTGSTNHVEQYTVHTLWISKYTHIKNHPQAQIYPSTPSHTNRALTGTHQALHKPANPAWGQAHFIWVIFVKVWGCGIRKWLKWLVFNAELKEVAYLDAIGWIVHDSGLWFLGRQERVYHAGLR